MKKLIVIAVCICSTAMSIGQNKPIALDLQKNVNLFTGNFKYQIPLMNVSGPNGERFPLNLNYRSGIQVEQESGWVGLGWSLPLGEIRRSVNGFPDDWEGRNFEETSNNEINSTSIITSKNAYGPLYFKEAAAYSNASKMDLFQSLRGEGTNSMFEGPDYDDYYVSGPGMSGKMRPYLFDFAHLYEQGHGVLSYGDPNDPNNFRKFSKEAQFRFIADDLTKVSAPFYNDFFKKAALTSNLFRGNDYEWKNYENIWDVNFSKPNVGSTFYGDIDDAKSDQRQRSEVGKYVEYFTNQEIHNHYTGGTAIDGFIDYENNSNRTGGNFDPDGIGAFRITNESGMVYHYSLPVYRNYSSVREFSLYDDGSVNGNKNDFYKEFKQYYEYATSWKLVAITGVDYEDVNNNSFVDEGDGGYWIYVNYTKWTDNYERDYPFYGCNIDRTYTTVPSGSDILSRYTLTGSVQNISEELYYPNYIKTSSHTAFFIKSVKKDNYGRYGSNSKTPKLKLSNIILLKNEDVSNNNFFATYGNVAAEQFNSFPANVDANGVLNTNDYSLIQSSLDPLSLKNIELIHDYSLAKGAYNNVMNGVSVQPLNVLGTNPAPLAYRKVISSSTVEGKLTLKGLKVYDHGKNTIYAPNKNTYSFNYGVATDDNPNYNHRFKDHFGYYKKPQTPTDFDQLDYIDDFSKEHVDAWSLNEIIDPLGGKTTIEYESNEYEGSYFRQGKYGIAGLVYKPERYAVNQAGILDEWTIDKGYGNGPRVKSISKAEVDQNLTYRLDISYRGGVVGIEPSRSHVVWIIDDQNPTKWESKIVNSFRDRFAPTSNVGYGVVKVFPRIANNGTSVEHTGFIEYQFNKKPDNFVISVARGDRRYDPVNSTPDYWESREVLHAKFLDMNAYGRTDKIKVFDKNGNVSRETIYSYSPSTDDDYQYGKIQELFFKAINKAHESPQLPAVYMDKVCIWEERNSSLRSITTKEGSITSTVQFDEYDKFTKIPKKTRFYNNSSAGYGEDQTFAYEDASYLDFGTKSSNPQNTNQLTLNHFQQSGRTKYSKTYSTFSGSIPIKKLESNGFYTITNTTVNPSLPFQTFRDNGENRLGDWEVIGTNTLFDNYLNVIETRARDGNFAATRIEGSDQLPTASARFSNHASFFHSSFEYTYTRGGKTYFDSEVTSGENQFLGDNSITPHTGNYVARIDDNDDPLLYTAKRELYILDGENVDRGILPGRTYEASVWLHKDSPKEAKLHLEIEGVLNNNGKTYTFSEVTDTYAANKVVIGSWVKLSITFTVPEDFTTPNANDGVKVYCKNTDSQYAYFDDFRLQPIDASVGATVYDTKRLLPLFTLNNENFYTRYEYDAAGNVIKTYQETLNGETLRQETKIHFAE